MRLSSTLLRPAVLLAVAIAALSSLGAGPRTADALTNCSVADLTFDSQEQAFLTLINNYRAQNGLGALQTSVNLNRAASWLAKDMADQNYFSHTDSLNRSLGTRLSQCDDSHSSAGENIAAGQFVPVKLADARAGQAPAIAVAGPVALKNKEIGNQPAHLLEIEERPMRRGPLGPHGLPKTEQGATGGMQNLGFGLACLDLSGNHHFVPSGASPRRCAIRERAVHMVQPTCQRQELT